MLTTTEFFQKLFGNIPSDHHILIWKNPGKFSRWFQSIEKIDEYIAQQRLQPINIYFGCGTRAQSFGNFKRGERDDVAGIPGFWVDIDIANSAHSNKQLPTTFDEAIALTKNNGWDPTLIINSGNGIHAWWLFKEFWAFKNEPERTEAEVLLYRLQDTIRNNAAEKGWTIDSTSDLPRILRPPGTFNHKRTAIEVKVIENNEIYYSDPSAFDEWLVAYKKRAPTRELKSKIIQEIKKIDANNIIPSDLFKQIVMTDPSFQQTWNRQRPDMKDQSPSAYHMSIANICAANGMDHKEIATMLIAWNRKHKLPLEKVMRPDYLANTTAKAIAVFGPPPSPEQFPPGSPDSIKQKLKTYLGLDILNITKYIQESGSQWSLITSKGEVVFKNTAQLISMQSFKTKIFEATNRLLSISKNHWASIVNLIGELAVEVHIGNEDTMEGRISAWLEAYLADAAPIDIDRSIIEDDRPFVSNGCWHIYPRRFRQFTWQYYGNVDSIAAIRLDLRRIGAMEIRLTPTSPVNPKKQIQKRPWRIPQAVVTPPLNIAPQTQEPKDQSLTMH